MIRLTFLLVLTTSLCSQATEHWPQFLGAGSRATGVGADSLRFDLKKDVRFRAAIPAGSSSPCVWGNQVFLTGKEGADLVMLALDAESGKERWRRTVPAPPERSYAHRDGGVAMATAATDGERVYFYLASHGVHAFTMDGVKVWEKLLPTPKTDFGIGSSPTLCGDRLILIRDGCPDAKLYALDTKTGKEVWSVPRLAFWEAHGSPFVWDHPLRRELIVASSGRVISFDPKDGKELWTVSGLTPLVCTTPVGDAKFLYFAGWSTPSAVGTERLLDGMKNPVKLTDEERSDPKALLRKFDKDGDDRLSKDEAPDGRVRDAWAFFDRDKSGFIEMQEWVPLVNMPSRGKNVMIAIKPGGSGDVTKTHVAWTVRRGIPYVASPLLYDGRVYLVKAGGILSALDAKTGKPRFRKARFEDRSEYYATPVGVDGHVLVCSSAGRLYVLAAEDEFKVVRTVDFGQPIFATPAVARGSVYVRTREALYAFGKGAKAGKTGKTGGER